MEQNKYNTFYKRLLAKVVDYIILGIASRLFIWVFIPKTTYRFEASTQTGEFPFVENSNVSLNFFNNYGEIPISMFLIGYFVLCHFFFGQTLGKAIFNVKILDVEENRLISFLQAFLRNIPDFIYTLLIFFYSLSISSICSNYNMEYLKLNSGFLK
ncbi:RDD family protein [Chryseobacterium sp.]|uniref:RDD family protein n=1 Tax=Chryseobacterium sp. TaxID=1871047 RepID=UPI002896BFDE|nr:RDD family protein [Chryseobacterium sp.]